MLNEIVEKEIMKLALADIDTEALAKKFKPLIQKKIESEFKDFLDCYEMDHDQFYDIMYDYNKKVGIPALKKQLFPTKGK